MKIYISVDMEGICGIVNWDCTSESGYDYHRARSLMTGEVNAAIRGALKAGASEVIVNDSHNKMTNIVIEDLHPEAVLISGYPKLNSMMEGLDDTFDGVLLIGYHSRINTRGVLNHTYSSRSVYNLKINGTDIGEFGLNCYIAGHYNVPVLMATGDDQLTCEAEAMVTGIQAVTVKKARGRYSALCMHPERACALIEEAAQSAIQNKDRMLPVKAVEPVHMEVTLMNSGMADEAEIMPGIERTGANTVAYTAPDVITAYRAFRTITALACSV
ncbi:MAG: D-aminopeptidase dipeptide-binding protein DppA [Firmicutes bacterium]|nr:D-aminopeptidase dipeptide-binding protein DppA [Bacillota bacterium]MDI6706036.1 M55 family metallopeptidase [Bacillota bacterium]